MRKDNEPFWFKCVTVVVGTVTAVAVGDYILRNGSNKIPESIKYPVPNSVPDNMLPGSENIKAGSIHDYRRLYEGPDENGWRTEISIAQEINQIFIMTVTIFKDKRERAEIIMYPDVCLDLNGHLVEFDVDQTSWEVRQCD